MRRTSTLLVLGLLGAGAVVAPAPSWSADPYVLDRMTVVPGATRMVSADFVSMTSVAEPAPGSASAACGATNVLSTGFWSILADLPVPILLEVQALPSPPGAVHLQWSGGAGQYAVCRSINPWDPCVPPYGFSVACGFDDPAAAGLDRVFYRVVAVP